MIATRVPSGVDLKNFTWLPRWLISTNPAAEGGVGLPGKAEA